jgi:hypothetical protein
MADLRGDGLTVPFEIPLIVVLWQAAHCRGPKRVFIRDEPNLDYGFHIDFDALTGAVFNDQASAASVHPGPDYDPWKRRHPGEEPLITLWSDPVRNFPGPLVWGNAALVLRTGIYPDLARYGWDKQVSAVRFEEPHSGLAAQSPASPAARIAPIPFVLRLHSTGREVWEDDNVITVVESCADLAEYGAFWTKRVSRVGVFQGPNFQPTSRVQLFTQAHAATPFRTYTAPLDDDLAPTPYNDCLTSLTITR